MAAVLALGKLLDVNVIDIISSFSYRSPSVVSKCGTNASDVANLSDLEDYTIVPVWRPRLYQGSMEYEEPSVIMV